MPELSPPLWLSLHVFYHGDQDRLVVEVLDEARARLPTKTRSFFLRYWNGGPHVRFRFEVNAAENLDAVQSAAESSIRDALRRHPSVWVMDEADYEEQAAFFGRREGVSLVERMAANNTMEVRAYVPETERYGTGASLAAVEAHFVESSTIAHRLLKQQPSLAARFLLAVRMAVVACDALSSAGYPDIRRNLEATVSTSDIIALQASANLAREAVSRGASEGAMSPEYIWHESVSALVRRLQATALEGKSTKTRHATRVVDLCTHLFFNRLGVDVSSEQRVRAWLDHVAPAPFADAVPGSR